MIRSFFMDAVPIKPADIEPNPECGWIPLRPADKRASATERMAGFIFMSE
jgi:hypothetical protein